MMFLARTKTKYVSQTRVLGRWRSVMGYHSAVILCGSQARTSFVDITHDQMEFVPFLITQTVSSHFSLVKSKCGKGSKIIPLPDM